ncbi:thaumatin-like protein 1b [Lathyrus oleraceus]|uniref:thaumatin-like protein 1b n=1 Tax=Pisum sativum TaxID=3888 RepID=UPI0021D2D3BD|nr:thaumatin-like protein 1b [Pisum sativum]
MESEFVALASASQEAEWLRDLLLEVPLIKDNVSKLLVHCDSQATLARVFNEMSNNIVFVLVSDPPSISISENRNFQTIKHGLEPHDPNTITTPDAWNGYLWGRTLCTGTEGNFTCLTGDCGTANVSCDENGTVPRATLAEFRYSYEGGIYFYNINVVEGFNIPIVVTPISEASQNLNCISAGCPMSINTICSIETCKPSSYSPTFKKACPQAYKDSYDNGTNTFSCSTKSFKIIFCPAFSFVS